MAQRLEGFAAGKTPDQGWITVKVKLRPDEYAALQKEAEREGTARNRRVYPVDLIRDGVKLVLIARHAHPTQERRFVPGPASEPKATPRLPPQGQGQSPALPGPSPKPSR